MVLPQRDSIVLSILILAIIGVPGIAQDNRGEVQIYIFATDGNPLEGIETVVADETVTSDSSGLLKFLHPPGEHTFTLTFAGRQVAEVTMPIRQGRATEAIITVSTNPESRNDLSVEEAEAIRNESSRETVDTDLPSGTLAGLVTHIETDEAVQRATVIFRGVDIETMTDADGRFVVQVPEGVYAVSIIHPDFSTQTVEEISVAANERAEVTIEMTPAGIELAEIPIFAAEEIIVQGGIVDLIQETRNSGVLLNLIGTEQIGRTGDSDAAAALQRVTGLTVVDGRYIYVRGMGERYSSSFLNDSYLPSPEIDKRVVPLDLFPTAVIESLAVQKSYSPDLPGDFGGGTVAIRSIGIPDDRYKRRLRTDIGFSFGYNAGTSFVSHLSEATGGFDWTGFDFGLRREPSELKEASGRINLGSGLFGDGLSEDEVESIGEALSRNWEPVERTIPLDYGATVSVRDKIELDENRDFGFNASVSYGDSWNYSEQLNRSYLPTETGVTPSSDYRSHVTSRDVDLGLLIDLIYKNRPGFDVQSTSLVIRATDGVTDQYTGDYTDDDVDLMVNEQSWVEQTLINQAFRGSLALLALNQADLNWNYSFSLANRFEPDHRYVTYWDEDIDGDFDTENQVLSPRQYAANRWFARVTDVVNAAKANVSLPIFLLGNTAADYVDVGGEITLQSRSTDTRRFNYTYNRITASDELISMGPDELLSDTYIGFTDPEFIEFTETTKTTDNYAASHLLIGAYASTDLLLFGDLRMNAGARFEWSRQAVNTYDLFTGELLDPTVLQSFDLLPAVNLTLPVLASSQVRVGMSRTVNRPDLRELSPAPKYGAPGTGVLRGNPDLKRAQIYSADARFESYLSEDENLSVGAFFKYLIDPIEVVQLAGAEYPKTFGNIPRAYNVGAELEWQLQLRFFSDMLRGFILSRNYSSLEAEQRARRSIGSIAGVLRDMRTTGNVALIESQIDYAGEDRGDNTSGQRPLQGQSPYVINATIGYKNSVSWSMQWKTYTSAFLSYNVFGPRISRIGTDTLDDFYEDPFHRLDLVVKHQFSQVVSVGLKAKNLIDPWVRETIGRGDDAVTVQEYQKGRSISLSGSISL